MNQRHYLIKGTFLLTLTGFLTKIAGFYYKIFLSRTIGAEQIGLFQLTAPVFHFCLSVAAGGVQMAISRFTAEYFAENRRKKAHYILACGLLLSGALAVLCASILWLGAPLIAKRFLLEARCAPLIRISAFSLPFAVIHGCIGGYFVGRKNIGLSAAAQMAEQLLRMCAVFLFYAFCVKNAFQMNAAAMALGQVAGELSAALFCVCALLFPRMIPSLSKTEAQARPQINPLPKAGTQADPLPNAEPKADPLPNAGTQAGSLPNVGSQAGSLPNVGSQAGSLSKRRTHRDALAGNGPALRDAFRKILSMSLPLTLTRMLMCILQGIEAAMLPQQLQRFGLDASGALTVYGTLTGMTMPLLLFPTAVTGALSTLLLPFVSEAKVLHQGKKITGTINASFHSSLLLGYFFFTAFLLFGRQCGELLFHSPLAGTYICNLALICPFLYLNTTLTSILHGLGKTSMVSCCSIAGIGIRLAMIVLLVPDMGIDGYFMGLLFSQAFISACSLITLHRASGFSADLSQTIIKPGLISLVSGGGIAALELLQPGFIEGSLPGMLLAGILYTAIYLLLVFLVIFRQEDRRRLLQSIKKL